MDFAIRFQDELWLMPDARNREMDRQDGEGVDKQVIAAVDILFHLFLRTVLLTEETGTLGECLLRDSGTCGNDTGRIPLHLNGRGSYG